MKVEYQETFSKELERFCIDNTYASFLQSSFWHDFQTSLGRKTHILTITEKNKVLLCALIIVLPLRLGKTYLYSPHGPLIANTLWKDEKKLTRVLTYFYDSCKQLTKKERGLFYRFDPQISDKSDDSTVLLKIQEEQIKTHTPSKQVQPKETLILDITKSEDGLLSEMHKKTRYNIRLAEKKGVTISKTQNPDDITVFYKLAETTRTRSHFGIHDEEYYKKQLKVLGKQGAATLYIAKLKNTPIAAHIMVYYKDTATYLHGASSNQHRNVMAPHLLQWAQICDAKKEGYACYDFWGITKSNHPKHPWHGITRFKKGFGGTEVEYIGAYDVISKPIWYYAYRLF
ncbi:peptidoglycan bridge formation glycyltransferase FemA/FemB family protein [Patescibacteria group bacterium]|nr:peptidoglycan bridge formation glycyltransferase FemA/FemB family protein [Patescibacteria group bacterium]